MMCWGVFGVINTNALLLIYLAVDMPPDLQADFPRGTEQVDHLEKLVKTRYEMRGCQTSWEVQDGG
jgi:hypothetical protein